ncbi:SCL-interrupting locus protein homolog isoform X1 [Leucoraja erinacea]|uniref:SCL-interrupting locus protein homolog isoform X1 n=1 Tax=Leucoraja erinaceus TaxID=7782 RepID=UPI002457CBA3|nr:SCL-interrupting locus protein homolog isoform X1 [Leucoraja erinacea]XP_055497797.1 SCL-interrupting locus protein homolog isoform X1 [Leucoraja erinacea]
MEFSYKAESHWTQKPLENGITPFTFPKAKLALWDPTPLGDVVSLHLAYYRNPKLRVLEKTLRLVHRHAKQSENKIFSCFLIGSAVIDDDDEGVTLTIDRFDPGREVTGHSDKIPIALLPGDFLIPCTIDNQGPVSKRINVYAPEDFSAAFKMLHHYCSSKESIDSSKLLTMRGHITCIEKLDNLTLELRWAAVTVSIIFDATPINPIPIIPTALARNLSSPNNIAQIQGTHKFGYLTMDQTRKLLLILESDPKVLTLPLVGIWLSGVTHVHNPQVWACCLRYLFSSSIHERVFATEQKSFLLVLYSLTHRQPEFYECHPCSEHRKLDFQLLTSTEVLNLCTSSESSGKRSIEFELCDGDKTSESDFFKEMVNNIGGNSLDCGLFSNKVAFGDNYSGVEEEDLSPRPTPSPHPVGQKFPRVYPSVPELSLVFDGSFIDSKNAPTGLQLNKSFLMKSQQTVRICETSGNINSTKQYSENGQPGLACQDISPTVKQNVTLSHGPPLPPKSGKEKSALKYRKGSHFARKSSGSSSSSSSTPPNGPSPDTSIDQPQMGIPTEVVGSKKNIVFGKGGVSPRGQQSISNSKQPQELSLSPNKSSRHSHQHSLSFPPPPSEMQLLGHPAHFHTMYPTRYCNCCQHHGPCCGSSLNSNWQGSIPAFGSKDVHSSNCHDCSTATCQQTLGYLSNSHCSARCLNTSTINQCLPEQRDGASPPNSSLIKSPGGSHTSPSNWCKMCIGPSAGLHVPLNRLEHDREGVGTMGLPVDAYKILVEQDKQLKLLQAQIQQLLDTQHSGASSPVTPCSSKTAEPTLHPERKLGFGAMETQITPGFHVKKSVSIAVSTGASLFWSPEKQDGHQLNDSESYTEEMTASITTKDTSHTSIASSLNEVDIHNFVEDSHVATNTSGQATDIQNSKTECTKYCWDHDISSQSPVLGESASMHLKTSQSDVLCNIVNKETEEHTTESHNEQIFYQNLMGQVNQLIESCNVKEDQEIQNKDARLESSPQNTDRSSKHHDLQNCQRDENDVLNATLKQLKKMGVKIDLESSNVIKTKSKVENASTLARISPEAVIPRLNYMSFVNVGTSGYGTSGVDLSMEANAIALKYLNDAQLSQMSLSRLNSNSESTFLNGLLELNTDRSMVGLSLISPSNMSFATRKYMKRYGLVEDCCGSDDEELPDTGVQTIKADSEIPSFGKERNEKVLERHMNTKTYNASQSPSKLDGNILRNITNEVTSSIPQNMNARGQDQQQILKHSKPNIKMVAEEIGYTEHSDKENEIKDFSQKFMTNAPEKKRVTESSDAMGNILDVNRLRQLPKLF